MGAIGLNPIRLDRIGLDPIRINAIKLGVPGAASGTDRPYIDPEVLASLKAVCICYGKRTTIRTGLLSRTWWTPTIRL